MRIESLKPPHVQQLATAGQLRVNNVQFSFIEGRVISDVVSENIGMLFDEQRGFNLLRDDLSIIRPAHQTPEREAPTAPQGGPNGNMSVPATDTDATTPAAGEGGDEVDEGSDDAPIESSDEGDTEERVLDDARLEEIAMHTLQVLRQVAANRVPRLHSRGLDKGALVHALATHEVAHGPLDLPTE